MRKFWPGHGWFDGKITKIDIVQSTVEADGRAVTAFQVAYAADGTSEDLEDDEISELLPVGNSTNPSPSWHPCKRASTTWRTG